MNRFAKQNKGASSTPSMQPSPAWRYWLVVLVFGLCFLLVGWRAVQLHVIDREFLNTQGDMRTVRIESIPATRGKIVDRNGEPLAVSAPVVTLWANPQEADRALPGWLELEDLLGLEQGSLVVRLAQNADKEFIYIQRQIAPEIGRQAMALKLQGLYSQRSHKRYYPAAEVAAHVVGMTNIDEQGQEGLELIFDQYLQGTAGKKKVLKDRRGYIVEDLSLIRDAQSGKDLQLSIDLRLQYMAYRELLASVESHQAKSASLVLLDVHTGEVLAMVNQPSYNPNNRGTIKPERLRNRAVTDVFEPGSTIKAFSIAAALESGKFNRRSRVETHPGFIRLNGRTIRDLRNHGEMDLEKVVVKSSNVGTSRIALKLGGESVWEMLYRAGFGQSSGIEYPGEAIGDLPNFTRWRPIRLATLSYGYGLSATPVQLAHAYMAFAADGMLRPVTLLKGGRQDVPARRIMSKKVANSIRDILEKAVLKGGTGTRAQVAQYRVAGKTGTVHSIGSNGYSEDDYTAVFAGFAPLGAPRLALVVAVHGPQKGEYYGGEVAAPVFSRVMANSLRLLNIAPDKPTLTIAAQGSQPRRGG